MTEREKLEQAIEAQERLRASLGDAVVNSTIAVLKRQLEELKQKQRAIRQRKQVTVLFADIAGFMAMSKATNAKNISETMNALWQRIDTVIIQHGGRIDKYIGDMIVVLFGVEVTHEDDPKHAIRAGLAMQTALQAFNDQRPQLPQVQMRVGINTGEAVLRKAGATEFTVTEETVNLATQLGHAAPVGEVLISHDTYRHVRGVFDVVTGEAIQIKGKKKPVQTYVVTKEKTRSFRVMTRGVEGIETRMIGRAAELCHLQKIFQQVFEDRTMRMVTVSGESGIGKSRLLYEFTNWTEFQSKTYWLFKARCNAQTQKLPYFLLRDLFAFRFQIAESDPMEKVREKMEHGVTEIMGKESREQAHFLGHLSGYSFAGSSYLRGILDDPKQIRNITFHYLTQFFTAIAQKIPTVILVEDIHWADDGSLDAVQHLVQSCSHLPILIVCLAHPTLFERRPLWGKTEAHHACLELQPLSEQDGCSLVAEILQNVATIPKKLSTLILNRTGGNPFYIEELIKWLIEKGVIITGSGEWQVVMKQLTQLTLPPTLLKVLHERLGALSKPERDALKRASVLGRIFWDRAVEFLSTGGTIRSTPQQLTNIQAVLQALCSRELIFRREASAFETTREYIFKHALLWDVTYSKVVARQRQNCHAQAAAWLLAHSGARIEEYAGLIGEHYDKAGQSVNAVEWYGRAGRQAQRAYAPDMAIDYYQRALALFDKYTSETPDDPEVYVQRIQLYEGLGQALITRTRYTEAAEMYVAMRAAAESLAYAPAQARAWNGSAYVQQQQGNYRGSIESAEQAATIARDAGTTAQLELGRALILKGEALHRLGEAEKAIALGQEALALSSRLKATHEMARDLNLLGIANLTLGCYAQAISYFEQALRVERELGNRKRMAIILNNLAEITKMRGDVLSAGSYYHEALAIAREAGDWQDELLYLSNLGSSRVELGDYSAAEADLQRVVQMVGDEKTFFLDETYCSLALACLGQGKIEEAVTAAQKGLTLAQESQNPEYLGAAWRALGQVAAVAAPLRIEGQDYTARTCFEESVRIFKANDIKGEQAKTLKTWAEYEIKHGDRAHGETLQQEAQALYKELGIDKVGACPEN